MKIKNIKYLVLGTFVLLTLSCAKEDNIVLQEYNTTILTEDFSKLTEIDDNKPLVYDGWLNFNEIGVKKWTSQFFDGNGYVEFSAFAQALNDKELNNVGWLISPKINMDLYEGEKLTFQTAQSFLRLRDNSLELLVSNDFDGTNVNTANWVNIPIKTAGPDDKRFKYINSNVVDLSSYTGNINFAFKYRGSGTVSNMSGTYQLDNINVFYPSK